MKKMVVLLSGALMISLISSATTWYCLTHRKDEPVTWKEYLNLSAEQNSKFSQMESDLNQTLSAMETDDAQNKIFLCTYLQSEGKPVNLKSTAGKMAEMYRQKQEKIALSLASISSILTPEQRKKFSHRLMQEVCVSCRNATGTEKCMCGMCGS